MDASQAPQAAAGAKGLFHITPSILWKTAGSTIVTTAGLFYLGTGKKEQDLQKMIVGAALVLAGFFLFF